MQKVLIVAPNASSRFGGEAFIPLKYFQLLRRRGHPAKLIAHARNREDLSEMLKPFLEDILFVDDTIWHRAVWAIGKRLPSVTRDILFGPLLDRISEHYQGRMIRRLVAAGEVDLIHQPTPVSPLAPSDLHRFGVPLVIGPMNGGMTYPAGYEDMQSKAARRLIRISRSAARIVNLLTPGKRHAAVLLVANERTRRALPFPNHPTITMLPENGVDLATWVALDRPVDKEDKARAFRMIFSGRLVKWKAVDITLEAVRQARAKGFDVQLDILGDGPERRRLEAMCGKIGLSRVVRFHGFVPQADCVAYFSDADALILNSVWECGGAVVLEAMAMGLPVIGPDWGGPAEYIDEDTGIRVNPTPRATYPSRIANAIATLASSPQARRRMGRTGADKIRELYDWERKVDRMQEIYANTLARNSRSISTRTPH